MGDYNMEEKYLIMLLQLVKHNGNIINFVNTGYDYAQTARHIKYLKEQHIIEYFKGSLQLTKLGENKLVDLNIKLGKRGSESFISPQFEYHIQRRGESYLYLPPKNK